MKTKPALCLALFTMFTSLSAQETPTQLSPADKIKLREAAAGYPQPPTNAKNWRTTASLMASPLWTQEVALVTVRWVFSNETVMVWQTNGTTAPFLSNKRPLIISVTTQRFDIFRAPEVVKPLYDHH